MTPVPSSLVSSLARPRGRDISVAGPRVHAPTGPDLARSARARRRPLPTWLASLLGGALWLSLAAAAQADATVVVQLKRADGSAANGTVLLSKGDTRLRCTTSQGRCEIKNVPGGSYTVEVEPESVAAGKPRLVMIPPSGEVKLNVAAK